MWIKSMFTKSCRGYLSKVVLASSWYKDVIESVRCSVMSDSSQPMNYSLLGSSVHRILQARILEWVAIPFSRGSSQPRDQTQVSCIAGRFFTV